MAQSKLINKGCYISNTSKRKILSALTEDRSMTGIASIDRFYLLILLTIFLHNKNNELLTISIHYLLTSP